MVYKSQQKKENKLQSGSASSPQSTLTKESRYTHTHTQKHTLSLSPTVPVGLSGEDPDHSWSLVDLQNVGERLKDVKVEEGFSRNGAVQTSLDTHTHTRTHTQAKQRAQL